MSETPRHRFGFIAVVAAVVLALDQLSKWWAVNALSDRVIPVVWTLQFNLAHNTGAAFSLGRGSDLTRLLPLLVLAGVVAFIWQSKGTIGTVGAIAVGMILGGAIGNLVDRALRTNGGPFFSGGVVDFIDLQWWPVFNVADMGVVVGGFLLVITFLRSPAEQTEPSAPSEPSATSAPSELPEQSG
jgi:signal peptidase II